MTDYLPLRKDAVMGEFGPWHLLIVAAVFVMLFGAKRLPDAARSLGRSARILKTEIKSMNDDESPSEPASVTVPVAVPVPESTRTS